MHVGRVEIASAGTTDHADFSIDGLPHPGGADLIARLRVGAEALEAALRRSE